MTDLKPLTIDQYDRCRERALRRVQTRIGQKPERKQFEREFGPVTTILDWLAMIVFVAALVISSVHIITHMGVLASSSYQEATNAGTVISRDFYVAAHQWGTIFLSEAAMILFMVLFALGKGWRRYLFLVLAVIASIFVILANAQSQIGLLESVMPPAFTIGVGLNMERIIVQTMRRRKDVTERYLSAMTVYETASQDATQHPEYLPILKQEIWEKLVGLKANQEFIDAPADIRRAAVTREMERDTWAFGGELSPQPLLAASKDGAQSPDPFVMVGRLPPTNGHSYGTVIIPGKSQGTNHRE